MNTEDFTKFDLSLMLTSVTQGYTHQKVAKTVKTTQKAIAAMDKI